jgi:hypothetical protein
MVYRRDEALCGSCGAICNLEGDISRKGVFTAIEVDEQGREKEVYYCGIGKDDCIMVRYGQKFENQAIRLLSFQKELNQR